MTPVQVEQKMQAAAEEQLHALAEVQDALSCGEEPPEEFANMLAGPCCEGCDTCTVREVLSAAVPILLEAIAAGDYPVEDPIPTIG